MKKKRKGRRKEKKFFDVAVTSTFFLFPSFLSSLWVNQSHSGFRRIAHNVNPPTIANNDRSMEHAVCSMSVGLGTTEATSQMTAPIVAPKDTQSRISAFTSLVFISPYLQWFKVLSLTRQCLLYSSYFFLSRL